MRENLKKVVIIICICAAIVAAMLFGLYKIFVTPEVIVGLALNNAIEDIAKSTDFFANTDEKEVVQRVMKNGGKAEMNISISESALLDGVSAQVTSNSDGSCAVTEINVNEYLTLMAYKDDERILINTPLFNGGFEIQTENMETAIADSVFADKIVASPETLAAPTVIRYITGGAGIAGLDIKELKAVADNIEIKRSGRGSVLTGGKTRKADEYTAHITSDDMGIIIDVLKKYGKEYRITEADMENILQGLRTDCDVTFKIRSFELYEVCIATPEGKKTISFTGEKNQFDNMTYYENDDLKNSVKRYHDRRGNNITETITVGDKTVLSIDTNIDKTEIRIGSGENPFVMFISGKNAGDYYVSCQSLEFGLEDRFMITSDLYLTEVYDEDFAFDKSGEYVNLFTITQDAWAAVSGVLMEGVKLFR